MKNLIAVSALALIASAGLASGGHGVSACLITKADTNPFFVKMRRCRGES